jgi:hypothetical protein
MWKDYRKIDSQVTEEDLKERKREREQRSYRGRLEGKKN